MSVRLDHGGDDLGELHEINVTPFIDVMLVLLIIFMVAAPLATVDIAVDLPASNARAEPAARQAAVFDAQVRPQPSLVGDAASAAATLAAALDRATGGDAAARIPARRQKRALRRPDGPDERLARAGYLHVALVGLEADKAAP